MTRTRIVRMRPGLERDAGENVGTQIGFLKREPIGPFDPKAFFVARFASIKDAVARHAGQGVLILAYDQAIDPVGELWLVATLDKTRAGVIGRHSLCDLMVPSVHGAVSLRHLAVMVRAVDNHEVRIRAIDLHTGVGFTDEAGRVLQAVTSDAPLFLRLPGITLLMLRTPEPGGFPDDAEAAYRCLPPRVFMEELEGVPANRPKRQRSAIRAAHHTGQTIVRATSGPVVAASDLCAEDEVPRGSLTARAGETVARRKVGPAALERGILIGRYDRCQLGAVDDGASSLSRVHVMIVSDGDDVLALDTASTNGTQIHGREQRIAALSDGDVLQLSSDLELVWNSAS